MMRAFDAAPPATTLPHASSIFTGAMLDDVRFMRAPGGLPLFPAGGSATCDDARAVPLSSAPSAAEAAAPPKSGASTAFHASTVAAMAVPWRAAAGVAFISSLPTYRRRFCPSVVFVYFAISWRHRHVVGRHEVAKGAAAQRRPAKQRSTLRYNYAAALRTCRLAICVCGFELFLSSDRRH